MIIAKEICLGVLAKSRQKALLQLLSEFMLQQTQVKTVIPYFIKFTKISDTRVSI